MAPRKRSKKLEPAHARELEIAAAVAREAALQLHISAASRLIELCADRLSVSRVLSIYLRLHGFTTQQAEIVSSRVLAHLGQSATRNGARPQIMDDEELAEQESLSLFRSFRARLRGRVHHDLRRWMELHTGATQIALLQLHVGHAEQMVQRLAETHPIDNAIDVYVELAEVAPAWRDLLYYTVVDRLAAEELPVSTPAPASFRSNPISSSARERLHERAARATRASAAG